MKDKDNSISIFGQFMDKDLEKDFMIHDMMRYVKIIGSIAIISGAIFMLFIISDYYAIVDILSFRIILTIRVLFLTTSVLLYLVIKRINNFDKMTFLISAYEVFAIISFLIIMYQYESLTYLSYFSITAIILAIYITPNKLIYSQMISLFLCIMFFVFYARKINYTNTTELMKVVAYTIIVMVFCNIEAYLTNLYKRRHFADRNELLKITMTDSLTGTYNRIKLDEEIKKWIDYSSRYKSPFSLVIFDIDNFKKINDVHGHLVGDKVIKDVVSIIKTSIRNTDIFARWGGDEFVTLLPNTDISQALKMTERMKDSIQAHNFNLKESITCSFGLIMSSSKDSAESLLQRADDLLYGAKDCGKNTIMSESLQV